MIQRARPARLLSGARLADGAAILLGLIFLVQIWGYAHTRASLVDEGAYLYKGYLYMTGEYRPFQDYGPWTNHMPLAFLIPGAAQVVFGPGLQTGRYFAVAVSLLMFAGLYLLARRFGGPWWAAAALAVVALNPAMLKTYSLAISQGLVASILVWILVLTLGEGRPKWQVLLGAGLAGALMMVRINMTPFLPLLLAYIFWQHGRRSGLQASAVAMLTVVVLHTFFWPDILRLWAHWLPKGLTPFLDSWRLSTPAPSSWSPDNDLFDRLFSFLYALRANFVPVVGVLGLGLLGLFKNQWVDQAYRRTAVFLSASFLALLLVHAWASLGNDYCVFCLSGYLTFFSPLGILLVVVTNAAWRPRNGQRPAWIAALFVLTIAALAGYGAFQEIGPGLAELPVPRFKGGRFLPGSVPLWGMIYNGTGVAYEQLKWLLPLLLGLAAGGLILTLAWILFRSARRGGQEPNFGLLALNLLLAAGLLLSPTRALAQNDVYDCSGDVIAAYDETGRQLAETIPAGSTIFWQGTLSIAPLLQAPELKIYPPQINNGYAYRTGGEAEELYRFGLWNQELKEEWRNAADFVIIEERRYDSEWKAFLESGAFDELTRTQNTTPCRDDARLRIFRRR